MFMAQTKIELQCRSLDGSSAVWAFTQLCHPERSRFSGVAKDLPLNRPNA